MHPPVVLIPLDGSPAAEYALPQAEAAARSQGHSLRLLGIVDAGTSVDGGAVAPSLNFALLRRRVELEDYLHRMARSLQLSGIMAEVLVLCGAPETVLPAAVGAAEVMLTVIARPEALAEGQALAFERLVIEAANGAVLVVQPQLEPA